MGISARILTFMQDSTTVTRLWEKSRRVPEINSFDKFIYGLDFLFSVGLVDLRDGLLIQKR